MSYPAADRLDDAAGRVLKGRRIARILSEFGQVILADARVLDLGASHLRIARSLAEHGADVVGLDTDHQALGKGSCEPGAPPQAAVVGSGMALPFADATFDVVVCNHVYEHVSDPQTMLAEIRRVLRTNGICYFAGGHKYQLIEPHFRLPLLSWLPPKLADRYLRAAGMGDRYDIRFATNRQLRTMLASFGWVHDCTLEVLRQAAHFEIGPQWLAPVLDKLPDWLLARLAMVSPTRIWLLKC